MIRKYVHVDAPVEDVAALFHHLEGWPEWMPGIRSVKILSRSNEMVTAKFVHRQMGQTFSQIVECRLQEDGLVQHQKKGRFRKWEMNWQFRTAPAGGGTTIALEMDIDIGALNSILFSGLLRRSADQIVRDCARNIRRRLYVQAGDRPTASALDSEILLQVFERDGELEVRIGDRIIRVATNQTE
ncbi:MAG: SRPBCC family protein [bacterium]|nr:SRPBCC family protein [bacterium]